MSLNRSDLAKRLRDAADHLEKPLERLPGKVDYRTARQIVADEFDSGAIMLQDFPSHGDAAVEWKVWDGETHHTAPTLEAALNLALAAKRARLASQPDPEETHVLLEAAGAEPVVEF